MLISASTLLSQLDIGKSNAKLLLDKEFLQVLSNFQRRLLNLADTDQNITAVRLKEAIKNGELPLLQIEQLLVINETKWLLEPIERAIPFLLTVCEKPRKHLKTEEAVRPIETVRRTGPVALRHLASHSEHWQIQTISGLKPARLLAQTIEDEVVLYENRFIRSLIERLAIHLRKTQEQIKEALSQTENALDWSKLGTYSWEQSSLLNLLLPSFKETEFSSKDKDLRNLLKRVKSAQTSLSNCIASNFYQALRLTEPVFSPIRPTNILTKDVNYNPLYQLWLDLDRMEQVQLDAGSDELLKSEDELVAAYQAFCQVILWQAFNVAKFRRIGEETDVLGKITKEKALKLRDKFRNDNWFVYLNYTASDITNLDELEKENIILEFQKDLELGFPMPKSFHQAKINLPEYLKTVIRIENAQDDGASIIFIDKPTEAQFDQIANLFEIANNNNTTTIEKKQAQQLDNRSWRKFITELKPKIVAAKVVKYQICLSPVLIDLTQLQASNLTIQTSELLLDSALTNNRTQNFNSTIILTPTSPLRLASKIPGPVLRRLITIGDNFVETDALKWGSRQTGILPISFWQINSLQRLVRLLNVFTLHPELDKVKSEPLKKCPNCGSEAITKTKDELYHCQKCDCEWGETNCSNANCKHHFGFLRFKRRNHQTITDINDYGALVEKIENITGTKGIIGYCEKISELNNYILICPKCGNCPKNENQYEINKCFRCRGRTN